MIHVSILENLGCKRTYSSGNAFHLAEYGRQHGTLATSDISDDSSQATLLDGQVDAMNESGGLLIGLGSILFGPSE